MTGLIDEDGNELLPFKYIDVKVYDGCVTARTDSSKDYLWGFYTFGAAPDPTVGGFSDVKESDFFADAVLWAVEKDITSGTGGGMFSPNVNCTVGQIITFLWRASGSPEPAGDNPFTDVSPKNFYYKAALWAEEKGLVSGPVFAANADCTRAMTVEYLWKAAGCPAAAKPANFTDVPSGASYAPAVAWAVENGITSGTGGGKFSPNAICTRGQIVTFLHRAMG